MYKNLFYDLNLFFDFVKLTYSLILKVAKMICAPNKMNIIFRIWREAKNYLPALCISL